MKLRPVGLALLISSCLFRSVCKFFDSCHVCRHNMCCETVNCQHFLHVNYDLISLLSGWLRIEGYELLHVSDCVPAEAEGWLKSKRGGEDWSPVT